MRENLFRVIRKLEEYGWRCDADLVKALRHIAEKSSEYEVEEVIEALREA